MLGDLWCLLGFHFLEDFLLLAFDKHRGRWQGWSKNFVYHCILLLEIKESFKDLFKLNFNQINKQNISIKNGYYKEK